MDRAVSLPLRLQGYGTDHIEGSRVARSDAIAGGLGNSNAEVAARLDELDPDLEPLAHCVVFAAMLGTERAQRRRV
jgi:hypothetical protein